MMTNAPVWMTLAALTTTTAAFGQVVNSETLDEYDTIQDAIDAWDSGVGGSLVVMPGTYTASDSWVVDFRGKPIYLRSIDGAATTIIDGEGLRGCFRCETGEGLSTIIEGFTITNGMNASGSGGIQCQNTDPTIRDCVFTDNTSLVSGGAIRVLGGDPSITDCSFSGNAAAHGGAVSLESCEPTFTDCTFTSNTATGTGGAIRLAGCTLTLADHTFTNNSADGGGGALATSSSTLTMQGLTFTGNSASGDGGAVSLSSSDVAITDSDFTSNSAANNDGGAVHCNSSMVDFSSITFSNNTVTGLNGDGGAVRCAAATTPTFTTCTFTSNGSQHDGGAIHCTGSSNPTIDNCLIEDNTASYNGGGVFCDFSQAIIRNGCDIRANTAGIQGGGLYSSDSGSQPIPDVSDATFCGNVPNQVHGDWDNIGGNCLAFTCLDMNGDGAPDGCDSDRLVPDEYDYIDEAVHAANDDDTIIVAPGTYGPPVTQGVTFTLNPRGKRLTIRSSMGATETTLTGEGVFPVVVFENGEGGSVLLDGFTITNGYNLQYGGGMVFSGACAPTITNCIITGNYATYGGGFACLDGAAPTMAHTLVTGNIGGSGGGGLLKDSSPSLSTVTFSENEVTGSGGGGGLWISGGSPVITNCLFDGNTTSGTAGYGGGMRVMALADVMLTNCSVTNNESSSHGGGLAVSSYSTLTASDCVISGNQCVGTIAGDGGGLYADIGSTMTLSTTDIEDNSALNYGGGIFAEDTPVTANALSIRGNTAVDGAGVYMTAILPFDIDSRLTDSTFANNTASGQGGGLFNSDARTTTTLIGCTVSGNVADTGGGSYLQSGGLNLSGTLFCGNQPQHASGGYTDDGGNTENLICAECVGDMDGSNTVDVVDLQQLFDRWAEDCGHPAADPCYEDITGDQKIGIHDLMQVLTNWGQCL